MEKKLTNSDPLREPADKHSICTIKLILQAGLDMGRSTDDLPGHKRFAAMQRLTIEREGAANDTMHLVILG
jgi:hypothetical protein